MDATGETYEFGAYVLDVGERRLWSAGQIVPLAPKAHDVLVALVRRAGTLVTKRELLDLVWHDVSVEEGVLSVYVSALRKSLGDSGGTATYIDTVPRAGYRFSANVSRRAVAAEPLSMKWPIGVLPAKPEASELIGRGRACLMTASRSEVPRAVEAFRSAIALDPDYAAAHAGLAVAHCAEAELRLAAPDVAYSSARAAAVPRQISVWAKPFDVGGAGRHSTGDARRLPDVAAVRLAMSTRRDLLLESLALRHQLVYSLLRVGAPI